MRYITVYSRWVVSHRWQALGIAAAMGLFALVALTKLEFNTNFAALLPDDDPMVMEMDALRERAGGTVDLIVAIRTIDGPDPDARLAFARDLVTALRRQPWILRADAEFPVQFFQERQLWLVGLNDLKRLDKVLADEIELAKARANPFFVDLEEDEAEEPWERVEGIFKHAKKGAPRNDAFLRSTLTSKDKKWLFVRVKPVGKSMDLAAGKRTLDRVERVVAGLNPAARGIEVRYTGSVPVNQVQNATMLSDLKIASAVALALILIILTTYTRHIATPVIIGVPLVLGVLITLGITALTLGQLNLVSGFLITALIGIGVDFGIHLYLRYLEKLRRITKPRVAMASAMVATFPSCITAALTTSAAFLALTYSDFRGFREYGLIAGYGIGDHARHDLFGASSAGIRPHAEAIQSCVTN